MNKNLTGRDLRLIDQFCKENNIPEGKGYKTLLIKYRLYIKIND